MSFLNKLVRPAVMVLMLSAAVHCLPGNSGNAYAGTLNTEAVSVFSSDKEAGTEDAIYTVSGQDTVCGQYDDELSDQVIELINSYREQAGLGALKVSAARIADAEKKVLSSAYNYKSFSTVNSVKGLRTATVTAMGYGSAQFLVNSMTISSGTKAKILNRSYRYIGVSVFASAVPTGRITGGDPESYYRYYVVVSLGR
ncbi:MAG: hypothetical protein K5637_07810 [Lachnospiraceae bacterium]|nr:hypothetical protein [Lachnospiraceae bacterium]